MFVYRNSVCLLCPRLNYAADWNTFLSVCVCVLKDVDQSTLVHITVLERHVLTFAHINKHRPKQTHTGSPATTWRWTDAEMCSDSSQTLSVFGTDYVMATLTRGFKEGQGEWKGGRNKTISLSDTFLSHICPSIFRQLFLRLHFSIIECYRGFSCVLVQRRVFPQIFLQCALTVLSLQYTFLSWPQCENLGGRDEYMTPTALRSSTLDIDISNFGD